VSVSCDVIVIASLVTVSRNVGRSQTIAKGTSFFANILSLLLVLPPFRAFSSIHLFQVLLGLALFSS
jgi:hypothetical protein